VQNGKKTKAFPNGHAPPSARDALAKWRNIEPFTMREELAVICNRSISTVDRWVSGKGDPTLTDVWLMEKHKPGLVEMLFGRSVRAARTRRRAAAVGA
jgi:hypothetical protein